jgi:AraC family transcriptional activator of tynA and feaB
MHWRTAGAITTELFSKWADNLAQAFVRLEPDAVLRDHFRGDIDKVPVGDIQLSRVTASGHRVRRLREHIRRSDRDVCFVNLQIAGVGITRQRGHEVVCGPLDLAVVDTTEAFEILHRAPFDLYSIEVPRRLVPGGLLERGGAALSQTGVGRQIAQALLSYSSLALYAGDHTPVAPAIVSRHVVELLACLAQPLQAEDGTASARHARLAAMCNYIERNLDDEQLGAERIAAAFGVTARYVHKLFAMAGRTVSQSVCDLRIERARRLLEHPQDSHSTITAIAFQLGFRDISYFNRRFKERVGESPSDYRKHMLLRTPG